MYRKLFSIMVLMITVLTVNLLTGWLTDYIVHYNLGLDPYKFTAIAMLALVFILVPAYSYLHLKIEVLIAKIFFTGGNSFARLIGLVFSFSLAFGILFSIYLYEWFDINILIVLRSYIS
jgi:hypothetical protein